MGENVPVLGISGRVLSNKINMRNNMGNNQYFNQQQIHSHNTFLHFDGSYYLHCILETIRQDFKAKSVGLKLADIFGLPAIAFSVLDILFDKSIFDAMPTGFKYTMFVFACGYLLTLFMRGYEKYRADKLINDKNQFNWQREKEKILKEKK